MPPHRRVLVHGHRGARAVYPENTLPAFIYAIEAGADAIELDGLATRDDVLVVAHDPHINSEICQGPHPGIAIRKLTLAEVREHDWGSRQNPNFPKQQAIPGARIPALAEVLSLSSRGSFQFDIEVKSFPDAGLTPAPDVAAKMLLDEIRKHGLEKRVVVQSFDFRVLHAVKQLAPEIRLAALWSHMVLPFVSAANAAGADIVSPEYRLVTADQVSAAHAANLQVVPWTANASDDWQRLIDADVDGIITDDPAALLAYLNEQGRG